MQLELRCAEPMAQLVDLRAIPIVQMLARAEYLDRGHSCLPDFIQPNGIEPVIHQQMCRYDVFHKNGSLVHSFTRSFVMGLRGIGTKEPRNEGIKERFQYPSALALPRPSAAPCSQPVSFTIASTRATTGFVLSYGAILWPM